ncbi:MAG: hypothetical protein HZB75_03840 [Candidatus Saccharibacteria bacterium]|nr:MAG: hypothetical protein HZB75_03840 [Candidatus Saccharibacteria bacterium]
MALQPSNGGASLLQLLRWEEGELVGGGVPVVRVAVSRHGEDLHDPLQSHGEASREEFGEENPGVVRGVVDHAAQREALDDHLPGLEDVDATRKGEASLGAAYDHFAPGDARQVFAHLTGEVESVAHVVGLDGDDTVGVVNNDGPIEFVSEQGCGVEHGAVTNLRFVAGAKGLFIL